MYLENSESLILLSSFSSHFRFSSVSHWSRKVIYISARKAPSIICFFWGMKYSFKYALLGVLGCSIAKYFYALYRILTRAMGKEWGEILNTLHTKTSNKLFIIQLLFFLPSLSVHFSYGRKAKRIEKRSVRCRLVIIKQAFLQNKRTNCPYNRAILQNVCALFACYLYSTLCSWMIKA